MIDIENYVITQLNNAYSGVATVSSVFTEEPESFPWVYARQISNAAVKRYSDDRLHAHAVNITIRIECYSALTSGAKQEVKNLLQIGDECMQNMKFTCTASNIIPNYDRSVTRGYADYTAMVWEPQEIDGDTVYQMYRR